MSRKGMQNGQALEIEGSYKFEGVRNIEYLGSALTDTNALYVMTQINNVKGNR